MNTLAQIAQRYATLAEAFRINCGGWDAIHCYYSHSMFCPENRKSLIAEYLIWEEFVKDAKKVDCPYYVGIDDFLREYKTAVYSCLTHLD